MDVGNICDIPRAVSGFVLGSRAVSLVVAIRNEPLFLGKVLVG